MEASQADQIRKAIESLIDAKLLDALSKPGGLDRLLAYRATGVAPFGVRMAQRKLTDVLQQTASHQGEHQDEYATHAA
ncbi:MAG TPA: hypothetical protein PLD59_16650 [Tepidisphaeraceae bacterium]|nr:hypothetical protein [Tepidisphaeraceae bacterium]